MERIYRFLRCRFLVRKPESCNMEQCQPIQQAVNEALSLPADSSVWTLLLRERQFVGYKVCFDGGYAVLLAGQNVIEVYDEGDRLLKTVRIEPTETGKAA
jgi:hypothetical protein